MTKIYDIMLTDINRRLAEEARHNEHLKAENEYRLRRGSQIIPVGNQKHRLNASLCLEYAFERPQNITAEVL